MADQRRRTVSPGLRQVVPKADIPQEDIQHSPSRSNFKKSSSKLDNIESDALLVMLKENRERLCQCFDIY